MKKIINVFLLNNILKKSILNKSTFIIFIIPKTILPETCIFISLVSFAYKENSKYDTQIFMC